MLRAGLAPGLAIGLGAAVVDVAYASLGVAGTARLLTSPALRTWLGLGGAAVLVAMGARTLVSAWRVRLGAETPGEVASLRALRTSLAATASNPLTIGSWAAIFAAASAASVATDTASTVTLLAGVGLGTLGWFTFLSLVLTVVSAGSASAALRLADVVAGLGLIGFGGLLDGGRPATGTSPIAAEVAGVDGKGGWVAVVLAGEPPVFERAHLRPRFAELLAELAVRRGGRRGHADRAQRRRLAAHRHRRQGAAAAGRIERVHDPAEAGAAGGHARRGDRAVPPPDRPGVQQAGMGP